MQHDPQHPVDDETLYKLFAATLDVDKPSREGAERALLQLSTQRPTFLHDLLRFATLSLVPNTATTVVAPFEEQQQRSVLLAAAIHLRNLVTKQDWNRMAVAEGEPTALLFSAPIRDQIKQEIIQLQSAPHVAEEIRRQLLATTNDILRYDYPDKWETLVPQLESLLSTNALTLQNALQTNTLDEAGVPTLLQLKGLLGVLRGCSRLFEDPLHVDGAATDAFCTCFLPPLNSLYQLLFHLWSEASLRLLGERRVLEAQVLRGAHEQPYPTSLQSFTPLIDELAHCLRLIVKIYLSLCATRWPHCWCPLEAFKNVWLQCVAAPVGVVLDVWLVISRMSIDADLRHPNGDRGDHFDAFHVSPVWKYIKYLFRFAHKVAVDFTVPKHCEKRSRACATHFAAEYLPKIVEAALQIVRWHAEPVPLTSKGYIFCLELLTTAVEHEASYTAILQPSAEELMTMLLFPRLCFSHEDEELWQLNPEEYVRKQTNPAGDLYSAKVVSTSLLLTFAVPTKKFHDSTLVTSLVNFIMNQLQAYTTLAAQATEHNAEMHPLAAQAARRVDAAFYCLFHFKKVLEALQFGDANVEHVLLNFVVPAAQFPLGFLRARAVQVLAIFAPMIEWSAPERYQHALLAVLPLLQDAETPVRVQACVSFGRLIRHEYARPVVTPCIASLIQQYFDVMRQMDNDGVVRTLRKTISFYRDSLTQWAVALTELLVQHFDHVLQRVSQQYTALEATDGLASATQQSQEERKDGVFNDDEDHFTDALMVADELMETLTTLVRALPPTACTADNNDATALEADTYVQIQVRVAPMLFAILSYSGGSTFGFIDATLQLLTTLLARSPAVAPPLWRLVPCIHRLVVQQGASDYFQEMLSPLDKYVSLEPVRFMLTPLCVLTQEPDQQDSSTSHRMTTATCAQLVMDMSQTVLQNNNLRLREMSAVARMNDAMLQSYFAKVKPPLLSAMDSKNDSSSHIPPALEELVRGIVQQALQTAATPRVGRSPTYLLLLSNNIFWCLLCDPATTIAQLQGQQCLTPFMEQFLELATRSTGSACVRSYDRRVALMAVGVALLHFSAAQNIPNTSGAATEEWTSVLLSTIRSGILFQYATQEKEVAFDQIKKIQRQLNKKQHQQNKKNDRHQYQPGEGDEGEEDDDSYEDVTEESEEDDDDDDDVWMQGGEDESDEEFIDDDEDENSGDAQDGEVQLSHVLGEDHNVLQKMAAQAQKARGGGGGGGAHANPNKGQLNNDHADGDDDDDPEENLLDEEDFATRFDRFNCFHFLQMCVQHGVLLQQRNANENRNMLYVLQLLTSSPSSDVYLYTDTFSAENQARQVLEMRAAEEALTALFSAQQQRGGGQLHAGAAYS